MAFYQLQGLAKPSSGPLLMISWEVQLALTLMALEEQQGFHCSKLTPHPCS